MKNIRKRWSIISLILLMICSSMPVRIVEAQDLEGEEITETYEENETIPQETSEDPKEEDRTEDISEDFQNEFSYINNEDLSALVLQGQYSFNVQMTIDAVKEETELEEDQINDLVEELFDAQEDESESDEEELPWQLDGSQVDTLTIKWVTPDDTENDDPALLYLKPSGNELTSARLQINYALSGEHNYEPGDVTITIPASMFKTRDGKKTGTITIPYPEDPSTKGDFNWKLVGDNYVLTNTKKMSAATKGYMQIEVGGLTPNQIADMAVSDPFAAKIEVVTWKGNLIGKSSNELTAQLDTEARIVGVDKGVTSAQRLAAEFIPEEYRIEGEVEYVVVDWWVRASINSNTKYTFEFTDMLPDEYRGFIIDAKQDSLQTYEYSSEPLLGNGPSWTTYYRVRSAYPSNQFEKDHTYTFHNNVEARVIEYDPEIEGNPNVQDPDPKLITKASDSAEIPFLFRDPEWINPEGHLYMNKNGNDDKPKNNLTHNSISTYKDEHLGSSGYYGIYPSALNRIEEGEDIRLSYTINSRAFLMPFTYEGDVTETELMKISNYFKHYLTLTTTDSGIRIGDSKEKLKVFEDFTYDSVEILEPWLYEGEPKNINVEDGTFIVMTAADGTYKYIRTSDLSKCPDITLEILQNGEWKNWASVSYKSGTRVVTYADGHSDGKMVIDLPEGTENFRTIVVSNNAGINYDVRPVITLKNTEALYELTESLFEKSNNPNLDVYNTASFDVVKDTEGKIFEMESAGRDSLRGYTTDTLAIPRKNARQVLVDYDNSRVRIRYDANVSEESLIPDLDSYKEAIESGRLMHETHGTWRDLLPKGVVPIMNSIRLRNGDSITDAYTIENYKGSGRTLLVVEEDLTVSPKTYRSGDSYYYMDQPTITFDCWYDFESIKDYGDKLHNVISFESSNGKIGTIEHYTGEPDDPTLNPTNNYSTPLAFENEEEKRYMTDLNPKNDDPAFLYAGAPLRIDVLYRARTSLTKDVDVNNEGYYSSGLYYDSAEENKRDVYEGGQYNYRLRMMSDTDTISKDLILFDFLESFEMIESEDNDPIDFDAPRWKGYLRGVDVSQLQQVGCAPVVYYSTKEGMNLERANPDFEAIKNVENTEIWIKAEDYEGDLDDVTAIAIDARRKTDGSDFILDPEASITAIILMQAPSGEEAREAISQKGKWGESAHAYNNAYLSAVSIDASTGEGHEEDVIRKDYTKVGLTEYKYEVEKVWDDSDNNDGIRPTSLTFVLYANDEPTDKTVTVDGTTDWKGAFEHIPYTDPEGNKIHYTAREERVEGYSASYQIIDPTHVKVTNRHEPEKITLSGEKTWVDESEDTRPESITVILKANGEEIKKLQVKPDKEGNWKYAFSDLLKYKKGKQIEYTIEEYIVKGKIASYKPEIDGYNIINIHHPYGDLYVDKDLINATDVSSETEFTFVFAFTKDGTPTFDEYDYDILDEDGGVLRSGKVSSADGSNKISIKASETIHVREIDEYLEYTVTEENCEGFSLASTKGTTGQILPNKDASARFSNIYKANGQYSPVATKVLRNRELQKYQFSFELYGEDDKTLLKVATSDKPETTGTDEDGYYSVAYATFGAIRYTQEDAGKTFTYFIHERLASKAGYIYDETTYRLEVKVEDNGDGTLVITPTYYKGSEEVKDPLFTNTYKAEGSLELKAWKELKNGKLEEGSFEFEVYDKEGEPIKDAEGTPLTARNDKEGNIVFKPIPYTEKDIGKEYTYVIKEIIPSEDSDEDPFIYDDGKIEYTVKVSDNGDGTLSTETLIRNYKLNEEGEYEQVGKDNEVPLFTNKLKPGKLTVSKYVINPEEADPQQEFRFKVKLIGEDVKDGKIEYELTAANEETTTAPIDEGVKDEEEQSETSENSSLFGFRLPSLFKNVYAEEGDIATGKSGTCDWRIDANGVLRVFPSDGSSGKLASYTRGYGPWYEYREKITKIVVESGVKTAAGCAYLFYYLGKCKEIDLHNLDTSEAVDMSYMLYGLGVKEMDLSSFDTTNVTNMQRIVMGCDNLTSIDLSSFDTSKVNNMEAFFGNDSNLSSIKLGPKFNFKGNNIADSSKWCIFNYKSGGIYTGDWVRDDWEYGPYSVSEIQENYSSSMAGTWVRDVIEFPYAVFTDDGSLYFVRAKEIHKNGSVGKVHTISGREFTGTIFAVDEESDSWWASNTNGFRTWGSVAASVNKVVFIDEIVPKNIYKWFSGFSHCTEMDLKKLNTKNTTTFRNLFSECGNLESIDVTGFDLSNVKEIDGMFYDCRKLRELDLSTWNTRNVTMAYMFNQAIGLEKIVLGENTYLKKDYSLPGKFFGDTVHTGKWVREDRAYGPFTPEELAEKYSSEMAGAWIRELIPTEYTIVFDAGGATGSMPQRLANISEEFVLPANAFVKYGFAFDHWDDGNGHTYANKGTIPAGTYEADDRITLTAIWNKLDLSAEIKDGEFEFTLRGGEKAIFDNFPAGTAYQVYEETPDGWVLVKQEGVSGTIEALKSSDAKFWNRYEPGTTSVQLYGTKLLDGSPADEGGFEFELYEGDRKIETVNTKDGGFIQFSVITYTNKDVGRHIYQIKETDTGDEKIRYDSHIETVTVEVKDNGDGTLSSEVTYDKDGIAFENHTNPGSLRVTKNTDISTDKNKDDEFKIKITFTNDKGIPLSSDEDIYWYIEDNGTETSSENNNENEENNTSYAMPSFGMPSIYFFNKVYAEEGDIASGTYDGVDWRITPDGELIYGKQGETQTFDNKARSNLTWGFLQEYIPQITSVRFEGTVIGQGSLNHMFSTWGSTGSKITKVDLTNFDTSRVTDMSSLFRGRQLSEIIWADFNTSSCTDMSYMFDDNKAITSLDIRFFDTSKVTNMEWMFADCDNLQELNMSGWDTRNVRNVNSMFHRGGYATLTKLKTLDMSGWSFAKITDLDDMFRGMSSLEDIRLNNTDFSHVKDMSALFSGCKSLKKIDLKGMDTSSATDMSSMFYNCSGLESLDLSTFDTSNVTNMSNMFSGCTSLKEINVDSMDTSKVTNMRMMFYNCRKLPQLDLTHFKTGNVTDMGGMFSSCSGLTSLNVSGWDVSNVKTFDANPSIFSSCSSLKVLDLSTWNTSSLENAHGTFAYTNFDYLDVSGFDFTKLKKADYMYNCAAPRKIKLGEKYVFLNQTDAELPLANSYYSNGKWIREDGKYGPYTPDELRNNWIPEMAGVWMWDYSGAAVLEDDGTLYFIKPAAGESYVNGERKTIQSVSGGSYTGTVYYVREYWWNLNYNWDPAWTNDAWKVKKVQFVDEITPNYDIEEWFSGFVNCKEMDLTNLDTTHVRNMAKLFYNDSKLEIVTLGPKFTFKGKPDNDPKYYTTLNDPPKTITTGKWIEVSETFGPFTAKELRDQYNSNMAGTWVWQYGDNKTRVKFDGNGGNVINDTLVFEKTDVSITTPSVKQVRRNGYKLISWNTKKDGTGTSYEPGETHDMELELNKVLYLYAQWKETDQRSYTVNHYRQNLSSDKYSLYETEFLLGEKDSEVKTEPKDYDGYTIPEAITITVKDDGTSKVDYYYDLVKYTLRYDGNGATGGSMSDEKDLKGIESHVLRSNRYVKKGSMFIGWNTEADGSGTSYTDGQKVKNLTRKNDDIVVLYAQWLENGNRPLEPQAGEIIVTLKKDQTLVIPELPVGTKYTIEEVDLPEGWTLDSIDGSSGVIQANETASANVTNKYSAKGIAYVEAHKLFEGDDLSEGQFTFELYRKNSNGWVKISEAKNDLVDTNETIYDSEGNQIENPWKGTGLVSFDAIEFDQKDIGKDVQLKIVERFNDSDTSIAYDKHEEIVSIHVEDAGKGRLETTVTYDENGSLFTNSKNPGELLIKKEVVDAPEEDKSEFTFKVILKDSDGNELAGEYTAIRNNDSEDVIKVRSSETFTLKGGETLLIQGLPEGSAYVLTEEVIRDWKSESKGEQGVIEAGVLKEAIFTNTYSTEEIEPKGGVVLEAYKEVEGGIIEEDDVFIFELLDHEGNVLQEKKVESFGENKATVTFDPIHYGKEDKNKTYTYIIREQSGDREDVSYDDTAYQVDVKLTDNGTEEYEIDIRYSMNGKDITLEKDELIFTNIKKHNVSLRKVDKETKQTLMNAGFTIRREDGLYLQADGSLAENGYVFMTGINGTFKVYNVEPGTYTLHESIAPAGYHPGEDQTFEILDEDVTLEVENEAGAQLPFTGGSGTGIFRLSGLMIAIAAALLLRRKKIS